MYIASTGHRRSYCGFRNLTTADSLYVAARETPGGPTDVLCRHPLASPAVAAAVLLFAATPAAKRPVHIRFSAFSGDATLTEDMGASGDTPIFFTEQVHWTLARPVESRIAVGRPVKVPVRITVRGSAHGVYAVLEGNGNPTQHVAYECSSRATRTQNATARIFKNRNGVLRLTMALITPGVATGA